MTTLQGLRVLVTRPRHQAGNVCNLIEQAGGQPVRFPVLEIQPVENQEKLVRELNNLDTFQWVFFISANAVNFAQQANNGKITLSNTVAVIAVGKATQRALENAGQHVDFVPEIGFNSEALLKMPALQDMQGQKCLIVRGSDGRELLAETLRKRGALVEYLQVYKRVRPEIDCDSIIELINKGMLDIIMITSAEALNNLVVILNGTNQQKLLQIPLIVISERINKKALKMGFSKIIVTENPSDIAIVKAIKNGVKSG